MNQTQKKWCLFCAIAIGVMVCCPPWTITNYERGRSSQFDGQYFNTSKSYGAFKTTKDGGYAPLWDSPRTHNVGNSYQSAEVNYARLLLQCGGALAIVVLMCFVYSGRRAVPTRTAAILVGLLLPAVASADDAGRPSLKGLTKITPQVIVSDEIQKLGVSLRDEQIKAENTLRKWGVLAKKPDIQGVMTLTVDSVSLPVSNAVRYYAVVVRLEVFQGQDWSEIQKPSAL